MGDGHENEDKDGYSGMVGHGDVYHGGEGLNVEVGQDCNPNLDSVANLLMKKLQNKKDASNNNDPSEIIESEDLNIYNPTSSIARIVSSRTDMLQKRKDLICMTSPSITMTNLLVEEVQEKKDASDNNDSNGIHR